MKAILLNKRYLERMTAREFFYFYQEHKGLHIEKKGRWKYSHTVPYRRNRLYKSENIHTMARWAEKEVKGLAFDTNTGFTLSNYAMCRPDASWIDLHKWNWLTQD